MRHRSLGITEFDIMAELEKLRDAPDPRTTKFTPQQDAFLWVARGPGALKPVPWDAIRSLWTQKWGSGPNLDTMRRRLKFLEMQGGPEVAAPKKKRG